jgi:hypothetical protein
MTNPRSHPRAPGRAEDRNDAGAEGAMARPVRQRAAAVQPPLPGEPAGLPHPGTGLWRAEARDVRRLERLGEELDGGDPKKSASAPTVTAHHRHAADPRVAGCRARRHRHHGRLRMAGAALQVAVRHRPRHHRHALERLGLLRPEEPEGADMTKDRPQAALRDLHPEILRGRAGAGVQLAPRPTRGLRGLHRQPAVGGMGAGPRSV